MQATPINKRLPVWGPSGSEDRIMELRLIGSNCDQIDEKRVKVALSVSPFPGLIPNTLRAYFGGRKVSPKKFALKTGSMSFN